MSDKKLTELPACVLDLKALTGLYLEDNELVALPEGVAELTELIVAAATLSWGRGKPLPQPEPEPGAVSH